MHRDQGDRKTHHNPIGEDVFPNPDEVVARSFSQYMHEGGVPVIDSRRDLYQFVVPGISISERYAPGQGLYWTFNHMDIGEDLRRFLDHEPRRVDRRIIPIERKAIELLALKGDESWLDLGGSDGKLVRWLLLNQGHRGPMAVMDLAPQDNLERFISMLHATGFTGNIPTFQQHDVTKPIEDMPDDSRDIVSIFNVLYHLGQPTAALDEALRITKPEGIFIMGTRGSSNMRRYWELVNVIRMWLELNGVSGASTNFPKDLDSFYSAYDKRTAIRDFSDRFDLLAAYEISTYDQALPELGLDPELTGSNVSPEIVLSSDEAVHTYRNALMAFTTEYAEIYLGISGQHINHHTQTLQRLEELHENIGEIIGRYILPQIRDGKFKESTDQIVMIGRPNPAAKVTLTAN